MAGTMTRANFNTLVGICKGYDPFTNYIDNYRQQVQAENFNKQLKQEFDAIMAQFGIKAFMPCTNDGAETENNLIQWLASHDITVEPEQVKAKRQWTEDEIKNLIQTNDKVLYGALKKLYACQTADEQSTAETTHANGAGFNAVDAQFLTSVSQFLISKGFLTDKQKVIVRRKLVKYNRQLTRLANM